MKKLLITGGHKLHGVIVPDGSKNSALACIAAACLATDNNIVVLKNIPDISDINIMCQIVRMLGKKVIFDNNTIIINGFFTNCTIPSTMTTKLRASLYFWGVLIASTGEINCGLPGGDKIGNRPIDIHISALQKMGVHFDIADNAIRANVTNRLEGQNIYLKYPSVGATCNIMLAASKARGKTVIINAAREPEIIDLSNFLTKMGIQITGAGTERIVLYGNSHIHGNVVHEIIPDRIETGVLAIASAITYGNVIIRKSIPYHNYALLYLLSEIGIEIAIAGDNIHIQNTRKLKAFNASMMPFPGIATDLQPIITVMATQANGTSSIIDYVFPERFQYISELQLMGAEIERHYNTLRLHGKSQLKENTVTGNDIRDRKSVV